MYGRSREDGSVLNFEASGALETASLVMRDRETDSWWSLMGSRSIAGQLEGEQLDEMDVSRKTQWSDWVARHPDTLVLSVEGVEHVEESHYDRYFDDNKTFRDAKLEDERLEAKQPIYSFWWDGAPAAVSHDLLDGGVVLRLPDPDHVLVAWRKAGESIYASTWAKIVKLQDAERIGSAHKTLDAAEAGEIDSSSPEGGYDTFWYTWVNVNPETVLLQP